MTSADDDSRSGAEEPADPLIGRVLADRFRIDAFLGRGAMGAVYRGRHLSLQRDVAIKVLHSHLTEDPMVAKRFDREALAASKLDHPNCVQVLDTGTAEGGLKFLVMQLLDGRELRSVHEGPMPVERVVEIARQMLLGLEHAHRRGLVHRDLKPENVFIVRDDDGRDLVKLVDFGIVKLISGEGSDERLTRAGVVFGTPHYMSPEQAAGGKIDERADLYALGVLVYEMLAGAPPFEGDEVGIVLRMHMIADPPPLPDTVPPMLRGVVMRLLEKDAKDRFASARDTREALEAATKTGAAPPAPPPPAPRALALSPPPPAPPPPAPPPRVATQPASSSAAVPRAASSRVVFMRAAALDEPAPAAPRSGGALMFVALAIGFITVLGTIALAIRGCASARPDAVAPAPRAPAPEVPAAIAPLETNEPDAATRDDEFTDAEEDEDERDDLDDRDEDDERSSKRDKEARKLEKKLAHEAKKRHKGKRHK